MAKKAAVIMPRAQEILVQMGEQIRLARLRRKLSAELVAERAGINRTAICSSSPKMMSLAESCRIWRCQQGDVRPRRGSDK